MSGVYLASETPFILDPLPSLSLLLLGLEPQEFLLLSSFLIIAIEDILDLSAMFLKSALAISIYRLTFDDQALEGELTLSLQPVFFWTSCSFLSSPRISLLTSPWVLLWPAGVSCRSSLMTSSSASLSLLKPENADMAGWKYGIRGGGEGDRGQI